MEVRVEVRGGGESGGSRDEKGSGGGWRQRVEGGSE